MLLVITLFFPWAMAEQIVPFPFDAPKDSALNVVSAECDFHREWPEDMVVYAVGAPHGEELPWPINEEGEMGTKVDLGVNSRKPVALILSGNGITIWNIGWTNSTRIEAVLLSGHYPQLPAGLSEKTPVITSVGRVSGGSACGLSGPLDRQAAKLNELSLHLFGRNVHTIVQAANGKAVVGSAIGLTEKLVTSNHKTVSSYHNPSYPRPGKGGLEQLVKKKLIRQGSADEAGRYAEKIFKMKLKNTKMVGFNPPNFPQFFERRDIYIVVQDFTLPKGMEQARPVILVPEGKRPPAVKGRSYGELILDLNDNSCLGSDCATLGLK